MCTVCLLLDKDKITKKEAMKALWEQVIGAKDKELEHIQTLYAELDKEIDLD